MTPIVRMQTVPKRSVSPAERIIVALDVDSANAARSVVSELDGIVSTFKIGLRLFTRSGPALVEELVSRGHRIFLDLKFHDIPNTVADASLEAAKLGVWMFNVHASGGSDMMRIASDRTSEFCEKHSIHRPIMIGVTVLTSGGVSTLNELAIDRTVEDQVISLADLALRSGLDGVVASAHEARQLRHRFGSEPMIVTPGIRSADATADDQRRVMTIGQAIDAGADRVVIGRPILEANDRVAAAQRFISEISAA